MQIGMIGLGRMGLNMARRLLKGGHQVVAYNRTPAKVDEIAKEGAQGAYSLAELVGALNPPRAVWLMLPAGKPVDQHLDELAGLLEPGDIVIEGGNSRFQDDLRRARSLEPRGILYLDAGVSGGIWGLKIGYCTMVGGPVEAYNRLRPIFDTLAPPQGHLHCGPTGAGHYVKMIHNGIEYGMMQAYAEGFDILRASPYGEELDLAAIARLWNQGSVVRSWLLELLASALAADPKLEKLQGFVEDSGEGRWSVEQAIATSTTAPVITLSLMQRFRSRQRDTFADKVLAALRREFGGHAVKESG